MFDHVAIAVTDPVSLTAFVAATGAESGSDSSFRADLPELVLTRLGQSADHLLIAVWDKVRGLPRITRR